MKLVLWFLMRCQKITEEKVKPFLQEVDIKIHMFFISLKHIYLSKRTKTNKSKNFSLFEQTMKDVENIYKDFAKFDKKIWSLQGALKRNVERWKTKFRSKERIGKVCRCIKHKETFLGCIPETNTFWNCTNES